MEETGAPAYFHSVRLKEDECKGCTNCLKKCPMEAIRVRKGKARIIEERCIDCGECVRTCPNHAKVAVTDPVDRIRAYPYAIALPAPGFYGQFPRDVAPDDVLQALISLGFADVFEVALAAEVVAYGIKRYIEEHETPRPLISSACPAVVRLIQLRFHSLVEHIVPIDSPMEVAAKLGKDEAPAKNPGLTRKDIGAFFITPCPAKMTAVAQPVGMPGSQVDGVVSASAIYAEILPRLADRSPEAAGGPPLPRQRATAAGIGWGRAGGESTSTGIGAALAVDGIHSVADVLEEVDRGTLADVDFIEAQACAGGCIGGCLMPQNPFTARAKLKAAEKLHSGRAPWYEEETLSRLYAQGHVGLPHPVPARQVVALDEDVSRALEKLRLLEEIVKLLPGLDCGACGSPSCRALAEDIVRGFAFETDCTFRLRDRIQQLAEEMAELARRIPPAMGSGDNG